MKRVGLFFCGLGIGLMLLYGFGPEAAKRWRQRHSLAQQTALRIPQADQSGAVAVDTQAERATNLESAWALSGRLEGGGLELPALAGDFTLSFWYSPLSLERPPNHDLINLLWLGQSEPLGTLASLWLDSASGKLHLSTFAQALWLEPGYHQTGRAVWVVLVRQGGRFRLYLDLEPQGPGVLRATPQAVRPERLLLGRGFQPQTGFTGLIGAPRLWERALAPEEVADLGGAALRIERWVRALAWEASLHQRLLWSAGFCWILGLVGLFADSLVMGLAVVSWHLRQVGRVDQLKLAAFALGLIGWYFWA